MARVGLKQSLPRREHGRKPPSQISRAFVTRLEPGPAWRFAPSAARGPANGIGRNVFRAASPRGVILVTSPFFELGCGGFEVQNYAGYGALPA